MGRGHHAACKLHTVLAGGQPREPWSPAVYMHETTYSFTTRIERNGGRKVYTYTYNIGTDVVHIFLMLEALLVL